MNTIKAYTKELVSNAQGEWIEEEKEVLTLGEVAGYSFSANTFQVMYMSGQIDVYKLTVFDRISIIPVVEDVTEAPAEAPVH